MVGLSVDNSRLKHFEAAIERGELLMMIDVPRDQSGASPSWCRPTTRRRTPKARNRPSPRFHKAGTDRRRSVRREAQRAMGETPISQRCNQRMKAT